MKAQYCPACMRDWKGPDREDADCPRCGFPRLARRFQMLAKQRHRQHRKGR